MFSVSLYSDSWWEIRFVHLVTVPISILDAATNVLPRLKRHFDVLSLFIGGWQSCFIRASELPLHVELLVVRLAAVTTMFFV